MAKLERPPGELSAKEVCRLLQPLFPHRVVSMALLNHWKKLGIEPRGKRLVRGRRSYTFDDVMTLAACFDLKDNGVQPLAFCGLVADVRGGRKPVAVGRRNSLTVSYDVTPLREHVLTGWDESVRRSKKPR